MPKNKFTKNAIEAINYANKTCIRLQSNEMSLEHLFMGILYVKEGIGSKILAKLGLDPEATLQSIEDDLKQKSHIEIKPNVEVLDTNSEIAEVLISEDVKKALEKAFDLAINSGHAYVGTEHLLLGMLDIKTNGFIKELSQLGIGHKQIKKELDSFVQYPDFGMEKQLPQLPGNPMGNERSNSSFLETFGRNLVQEARMGKLDPVIGRDAEVQRVMQILSRRTKNNPILLGDAGVGKTAIVEGLAQKIALGEVSPVLGGYEIWSVDTASIVAGSQLRGDVETKILDMINEIQNKGNIILFIDEIHTILGAGSTSNNSLDIANILKPALARGALHCIGATTMDEYRKYFDEDPALQRRFQPVDVEELSEKDTITVLKNLKSVYENFHRVKITDDAVVSAVKLSKRYIADRYLPDKAIDVLDEACSRKKLAKVQLTPKYKKELEKLSQIVTAKNSALNEKKMDLASRLLEDEKAVMSSMGKIEKNMRKNWEKVSEAISVDDIKKVITSWTKIPMNSMDESNKLAVDKLVSDLNINIIGQEHAVKSVYNSIKRAKAGLSGFERPLVSFLFVGPTGVGKTELAKQLALSLFGSKEALIQVDMSELMESHSVSKLIGSPPGYVGYSEGGQLTDKVRRRPFSVVLFDEIEKASPEVLNILLQIMDEGKLTDSKGRSVNFKNTIIIMTSNIGSELLRKDSTVGLYLGENAEKIKKDKNGETDKVVIEAQERIIAELKEYLQPEFLNRIDDVIVFRGLDKENIRKIAVLQIENVVSRLLEESNIVLKNATSDEIVKYILKNGYSEEYGAREIRRVIRTTLENVIAEKILEINLPENHKEKILLSARFSKVDGIIIDHLLKAKKSPVNASKVIKRKIKVVEKMVA